MQHLIAGTVGVDFENNALPCQAALARRAIERAVSPAQQAIPGVEAVSRTSRESMEDYEARPVFVHAKYVAASAVASGRCGPVESIADFEQSAARLRAVGGSREMVKHIVTGAVAVQFEKRPGPEQTAHASSPVEPTVAADQNPGLKIQPVIDGGAEVVQDRVTGTVPVELEDDTAVGDAAAGGGSIQNATWPLGEC